MSSSSGVSVRVQSRNFLLSLFLGFLLLASAWAIRTGAVRDPYVAKSNIASFTRMLKEAVLPTETITVTPSAYDQEATMSPAALMGRWEPLVGEASRRFNLPAGWIRAVMRMESGGRTMLAENEPITSGAGAMGIMQVEPGTYEEMRRQYGLGADPYDPHDNVMAGAAYLRWLKGRYGYPAMFAAYNDGPGNLEDHVGRGRRLPAETKHYIAAISAMLGGSGAGTRVKFTRPDGLPVWIDSDKVSGLRAAIPGEYEGSAQAVLNLGARRQAVREDIATATARLRDHGGSG